MWKKTEHHPWAETEMAEVKTLLSKKIKSQKIPGKAKCVGGCPRKNFAKEHRQS
ncbi:hypothetical protein LSH36_13g20009 [Paralvinella palmiformis]|uniref:Uncharacterized protein n=1 Tax=Paralvinella palmiformis TaxID=53620 RepID=A0AAD9NHN9_9ANNE|nr:hypothetical protein LSH36_13g20009 [Paralvinella palmiformis]